MPITACERRRLRREIVERYHRARSFIAKARREKSMDNREFLLLGVAYERDKIATLRAVVEERSDMWPSHHLRYAVRR